MTFIALKPGRLYRGLGAVMGLAGTASMHFLGIAALELPGVIVWDPILASSAVGASLAIAGITGAVVYGPGLKRFLGACLGGVLSIVTLHFVAMSAITLEPAVMQATALSVSAATMMNIVAPMVSGVICVAGMMLWTHYASRHGALRQIREAVEASPDGLAFFDTEDRLVLWNSRYAEVNRELASNLTAGMTFRQVVQIGLDEGLYAEAVGREAEWIDDRLATRKGDCATLEQRIAGDRWLRVTESPTHRRRRHRHRLHRHHRTRRTMRRPGRGARRGRGGQPGQERVPGQHEPRDPHAAERGHGHGRGPGRAPT